MTKKHFKALAEIAGMIPDPDLRRRITRAMIDLCRSANPNFDRQRFISAVEACHS